MNQEPAEQHRGRVGAGDPEAQQGHERRRGDGVVGGFRRRDAFGRAPPELLRGPRPAACFVVGQERRDRAARAGDDAFDGADGGPDQLGLQQPPSHLRSRPADARRFGRRLVPRPLAGLEKQLADGEQAHHDQDRRDAVEQVGLSEGEAGNARDRIRTDGRHHQAQQTGGQTLQERRARQRGNHAQAQDAQGEIRHRREPERQVGQRPRQRHQHQQADETADDARVERDPQGLAAAPLQLHRIAVEQRRRRRVGARRVNQDRRDRASIFRADVGGGQQHDRRARLHPVGEREQESHADRGRNPRQRPAQDAPRDAGGGRQRDRRGDQHSEPVDDGFHHPPQSAGQNPDGMPSRRTPSKKSQNAAPPPNAIRTSRQPGRSPWYSAAPASTPAIASG